MSCHVAIRSRWLPASLRSRTSISLIHRSWISTLAPTAQSCLRPARLPCGNHALEGLRGGRFAGQRGRAGALTAQAVEGDAQGAGPDAGGVGPKGLDEEAELLADHADVEGRDVGAHGALLLRARHELHDERGDAFAGAGRALVGAVGREDELVQTVVGDLELAGAVEEVLEAGPAVLLGERLLGDAE